MDALRTERVILRTLLLAQPGRAIFCALIAVIGLATAWLEPGEFRDILAPAMVAIPMAAFLAIAAIRLDACCHSAGALGIPLHLHFAQRAQLALLVSFVALPAIYLLMMGFGWRGLSLAVAAGVVGVHLFRSALLAWVVLALWLAPRLGVDVWAFASSAAGAAVIVALSAWGFAAWLRTPSRAQHQGILDSATLADSRHEPAGVPANAPEIDALLAGAEQARISPRMFWGALGHVSAMNRRAATLLVVAGVAVFIATHFYKGGRADAGFLQAFSTVAGLLAGWQFFAMQGAWATTAGEQSLLVLTPRWPGRRALKWLLVSSFWSRIPASLTAWVATTGIGVAAGWITWAVAVRAAITLFAVAFALFGFLLLFLAKRRLRKRNRLAMLYLVITGIAGLLLIPFHASVAAWRVLCLMLVTPAALALLAFCLRRPQFPVRPDADVVL